MPQDRKRSRDDSNVSKESKSTRRDAPRASTYAYPTTPGELKCIDFNANTNPRTFDNTGAATGVFINGIAAGTGSQQRVGRKVHLVNLQVSWAVRLLASTSACAPALLRVAYVLDRAPNGNAAAATYSEVFQSVPVGGTGISDAWAHPNIANKERFKILRDDKFSLGELVAGDMRVTRPHMSELAYTHMITINEDQIFKATGPDIADCTHGALLVFCQTDLSDTDKVKWQFMAKYRIRYTDA